MQLFAESARGHGLAAPAGVHDRDQGPHVGGMEPVLGGELVPELVELHPDSAESTRVAELQQRFQEEQSLPLLIVWERPEGIDAQTRQAVTGRLAQIRATLEDGDRLAGPVSPPIPSEDGQALQVIARLRTDLGEAIVATVEQVRGVVQMPGATA